MFQMFHLCNLQLFRVPGNPYNTFLRKLNNNTVLQSVQVTFLVVGHPFFFLNLDFGLGIIIIIIFHLALLSISNLHVKYQKTVFFDKSIAVPI